MNNAKNIRLGETYDGNHSPYGDSSIGYPQISVRTNRTASRSDLNEVINAANNIADKYPNDKNERAKKVTEALSSMFGNGSFGHAWIIVFYSEEAGDYTSYAYHDGYGYVHNNDTDGHTDDSSKRGFFCQSCVPISAEQIKKIESIIIPSLNEASTKIGASLGAKPAEGRFGVYTPITNCSWFAGNLWNKVTGRRMIFSQEFMGIKYSERWGIDALSEITEISDPGMISESITGATYITIKDFDFESGKQPSNYDIEVDGAFFKESNLTIPSSSSASIVNIGVPAYALKLTLKNASGTFSVGTSESPYIKNYEADCYDLSITIQLSDTSTPKYINISNNFVKDCYFSGYKLACWKNKTIIESFI